MATATVTGPDGIAEPPEPRRFGRLGTWQLTAAGWVNWALIGLLGVVTLVALLAPVLAPYNPVQPAGPPDLLPGSAGHLLGSDDIGRDILSRVIIGIRTSWLMALGIVAVGLAIGGVVGTIAGMAGGWVDGLLMRFTDMFLALPAMVVALAVAGALGPGLLNTFIAISVVWWPYYARIVRGEVRALAVRPHVEAARMAGVSRIRIMTRHLLPGVYPTAVITASLDIGAVVLTLAALSFLGLGQPAPAPELGADTSRGLSDLLTNWWVPVMPGLGVMVLSLVSNLGGDAVRNLMTRRT
ncbi:MAG TPA: ABC transporter permease [Trebonia sp.]|jgi:peptide/nickel transport system permease protein